MTSDVVTGDSGEHWFEPLADHMGAAYLRYSFTKGTQQEVEWLVDALELRPGSKVLDVGCGPGRHSYELAHRGVVVHGVDISERFIELATASAPNGATFERLDARHLAFDAEFDAVICLCQGAFGLMTANGHDLTVLQGMARALRPGGQLAVTAFSSYYVVKHWADADFDADAGVNHEHTEVRDEEGKARAAELWTGCYTPRELRLLCALAGLEVDAVSSVDPGRYRTEAPGIDSSEFMLRARRPLG
jgi:SAM-dependent methyltransferase